MSTTGFAHTLSPITLGEVELRNRIFVSAHVPGFAVDNKPGEKYIAYHRARAAGGAAIQFTGCTPIHRSGMLSLTNDALWNLDDSIIPGYRALSEAVHAEGGRIMAQIGHSGGTVLINQPGYESWSASPVRSEITGAVSHEMSTREIGEVIDAFADGAARAASGGMDGVEILAAFGYLPQAFFSPLTNHRKDHYGGSFENRMRFLLEVIEAVRERLGTSRILGVRIPGDEGNPGGLNLEAMTEVARCIADSGRVDYLNVIAYNNIDHTGRALHWPPTPSKHGLFVHMARAIKAVVDVPVLTIGRITDPAHAERILAAGDADMVGMTRAHITDPEIINKIVAGETDRIRPCVGANTCIASRYAGKTVRCMHNPALKDPASVVTTADRSLSVAVIGAGPGGLEAARIAATRGHSVKVYEAGDAVGGQLGLWASVPSMRELRAIIDWRQRELKRLQVEVELRRRMSVDDVLNCEADHVVVATGARPQLEPIPGDNSVRVITAYEAVANPGPGGSVLVWSDGRGQAGLAAAEVLAAAGHTVEIVTSDIAVAADLDPTHRTAWYQRLGAAGVSMTSRLVIAQIRNGVVTLRDVYTDQTQTRVDIELIVDWRGLKSDGGLYDRLVDAGVAVSRLGDCVAPRTVEIATAEASEIASGL